MGHRAPIFLALSLPLILVGCGARTELRACEIEGQTLVCSTFCGVGVETCSRGLWQPCTAAPPVDSIPIEATVRDFHVSHPDFEDAIGDDLGMVLSTLGDDGKPVYASSSTTPTTSGKTHFDEWFHDVPGVNQSTKVTLPLSRVEEDPPLYRYDDQSFFPIDGGLFGNEGFNHNFHFTLETNVEFRYHGGERFTFTGDDDLWVFINRTLAIDLGGVHATESKTIELDKSAAALGIEVGQVVTLALFFAERHSSASTFRIDTSIAEFNICPEK